MRSTWMETHAGYAKCKYEIEEDEVFILDKGMYDRIPSTTPGAEPPRDAKNSGSAWSHPTHLETSSSNQP